MARFNVGDKIAWDMLDGNVMCGIVQYLGFSSVDIQRVDGGYCTIRDSKPAWIASDIDIEKAIEFFKVVGL